MKKLILILFTLLLISNCGENLIEEVKERYGDGKFKVVDYYKKVGDNQELARIRKFYENGQISREINYKEEKTYYYREDYDENGQIEDEGHIKDGIKEGEWIYYYENGTIEEKGSYTGLNNRFSNPQKIGIWYYYHENGNRDTEYDYRMLSNCCSALASESYGSEGLCSKCGIYTALKIERLFINGWNKEGELLVSEGNGRWINYQWGDDNLKRSEGNIKNGQWDGEWIKYNNKEKIAEKSNYYNGERYGTFKDWSYYDDDTTFRGVGYFKDEGDHIVKTGKWTYYNRDGSINQVIEY